MIKNRSHRIIWMARSVARTSARSKTVIPPAVQSALVAVAFRAKDDDTKDRAAIALFETLGHLIFPYMEPTSFCGDNLAEVLLPSGVAVPQKILSLDEAERRITEAYGDAYAAAPSAS